MIYSFFFIKPLKNFTLSWNVKYSPISQVTSVGERLDPQEHSKEDCPVGRSISDGKLFSNPVGIFKLVVYKDT